MIENETETSRTANGRARDPHVSPLQVMESAAGHYVGTIHTACGECEECKRDDLPRGFQQPNSRETGYMSPEQAEEVLAQMLAGETPAELRTSAFNEEGASQIKTIELPPGSTAEDIYKLIHGKDA
jgi:hypothetical protein